VVPTAGKLPRRAKKLTPASRAAMKSAFSLTLPSSFGTEKIFVEMHFFVACPRRDCILQNVNCFARAKERAPL
jgi:hypothetical protein